MGSKSQIVIAIDGPAGAGKSTVAQKLAARIGFAYVDSGATYRAAALKVIENGVSPDDENQAVASVASADIQLVPCGSSFRVVLDGRDITLKLRTPEVTLAAAKVSRLPAVRAKLTALQRSLLAAPGVVMEGRDIGTVVFPDAPLKIFLTARPEERAQRRLSDDRQKGRTASLEDTAREIGNRDQLDAERKLSPLLPADDAVQIDSTGLTADGVVNEILRLARARRIIENGAIADGAKPTQPL